MSEEFYDVIGQPKTTEDGVVLSGLGLTQVHSFGKFTTCATVDKRCYDGITFHVVPKDCMPYSTSVVIGSTVSPAIKKEVLQLVEDYKPNPVKEAPIQLKIILKDDIPGNSFNMFCKCKL
ncbi:hypothetical protein SFRURICE_011377 [Spodoptera frugiperda]|nr:hypothetical protein SFRURICE_011377 [Spodoptera frugiperda]